ncbi:MAG: hypothetical protein J0L56_07600 [Chitinophagales bacterium]|nr:hypothetical protein [Chitinophagales bacterium]
MKKIILLSFLTILLTSTNAQPFKKPWKYVKRAVETGINIAKAPTETVIKTVEVVRGVSKPQEIFQPYKDIAKSAHAGEMLQKIQPVVAFIAAPQEIMYQKAEAFVAKKLGRKGEFVFDLMTFSQRFYNQLAPTSTEALAVALKDENPFIVLGAPLATAIEVAVNKYKDVAQPLPDDVKTGLQNYFSAEVLNRARYTVGSVEITLPNAIGQTKKFMGDHYAVVVDNIIVFNAQPPTFKQASWWWGHEVMHVEQYGREGRVAKFAYDYLKDLGGSIEKEANEKGDLIFNDQVSVSTAGITFYPKNKIFKGSFSGQEMIKTQCIIENDTIPLSYVVTTKSRILAVSPLNGEYVHIGHAKQPRFAGVEWEFSTTHVTYHVLSNGTIMVRRPIRNPSGSIINYKLIKVGKAIRFD